MTITYNQSFTEDFLFEVRKGKILGHLNRPFFGHNPNITVGIQTLWSEGGLYLFPPTAGSMTLSSTSAQDGVAGTGALTVGVEILDSSYNALTPDTKGFPSVNTFTMNGQTVVNLPSESFRFNSFFIRTIGVSGNGTAQGDIYIGTGTVTAGVPATVYAKISSGESFSKAAIYSVPNNFSLFSNRILQLPEIGTNKSFSFFRRLTSSGVTVSPGPFHFGGLPYDVDTSGLPAFPNGSDVDYTGLLDSGTGSASIFLSNTLVKNEVINI